MAQSPAMFNRSVLHSDNPNYFNTFDALYVSAFTYMPGEGHTGTKQPMRKGAWTRSTLTSAELEEAFETELIETLISGAMHFGQATPNRTGLLANVGFDFLDRAILVSGLLNILEETSGEQQENVIVKQQFTEFGGGLSLDVAKFGHWWAHPFILSGSIKHTTVDDFFNIRGATNDISFINSGLYWQFWRRAALMGGYQFIRSESLIDPIAPLETHRITQSQWAAGFEFIIAEGGVLNATVGQVNVKHHSKDIDDFLRLTQNNSSALRFDLNLSVKF
jgi:hypothetical protein